MQMEAGAIGITCQKLGEVEVFIDAGVADDILITFNIVGAAKTDRLMELSARVKRLAVVADNETVRARPVRGRRRGHGRDVPRAHRMRHRLRPQRRADRRRRRSSLARLRHEHAAHPLRRADDLSEHGAAARRNSSPARSSCSQGDGIPLPVLSGGGTPALLTLADFPMMTEHRAGTYVYNDVMMVHSGIATWDDCAMHVRTTVVSRPTEDRAIIDAGSKVLTREQYYVKNFGHVVEYPEAVVANVSEEHGMIDLSRLARRSRRSARSSASSPTIAASSPTWSTRSMACAAARSRSSGRSRRAARCADQDKPELDDRCGSASISAANSRRIRGRRLRGGGSRGRIAGRGIAVRGPVETAGEGLGNLRHARRIDRPALRQGLQERMIGIECGDRIRRQLDQDLGGRQLPRGRRL